MKDPPRLLSPDSNAPDLLREALSAGRSDLPSPERLAHMAERLAGILNAPAPPSPDGGSAGAPQPPAAPAAPLWSLPGFKVGLGVVLAVGIGGGVLGLGSANHAASPHVTLASAHTSASRSPDPAMTLPSASASASASEPRAVIRIEDLPYVADPVPSPRGAASSSPESVKAESALLQQAQIDLAADPARTLAKTAEHARLFPLGTLGQEREVIAITALEKLGRLDEARARASRFVARFPMSAHRSRMEALSAR